MKLAISIALIAVFLVSAVYGTPPQLHIGDAGLISGKPCSAPCFWNITPGVTSEKQALQWLGSLGNVEQCSQWGAVADGIEKGFDCGSFSIYFNEHDIVSEISVRSSERITVKQILERYGEPDAVYVTANGIDMKGPFKLDLIYSSLNMVVGLPAQNRSYYDVEPKTRIDRVLYSNPIEFARFIGSFNQAWKGYGKYDFGGSLPTVSRYGVITQNEAQAAQLILYNLHNYGVDILIDWGRTTRKYEYNDAHDFGKSESRIVETWKVGRWTLAELYIVLAAVENMDKKLNHHLKDLVGPVQISKIDPSISSRNCNGARACTIGNQVELVDNNLAPKNSPDLTDLSSYNVIQSGALINFDQWTIVHELAHAWENHYAIVHNDPFAFVPLSEQLVRLTGGQTNTQGFACFFKAWKPGCNEARYFYEGIPVKGVNSNFTPQEDFAESVAAYVFPASAQRWVENIYGKNARVSDEQRQALYYPALKNTPRWNFVYGLINLAH